MDHSKQTLYCLYMFNVVISIRPIRLVLYSLSVFLDSESYSLYMIHVTHSVYRVHVCTIVCLVYIFAKFCYDAAII